MAERVLTTLGTGMVTAGNQEALNIGQHVFRTSKVRLFVQGLVSAETADLYQLVNGVWEPYTPGGTQLQLDAGEHFVDLEVPGIYGFLKNASAGTRAVVLVN